MYLIIVHAEKKTSDPKDKNCSILRNHCTMYMQKKTISPRDKYCLVSVKTSDPRDKKFSVSVFNYCTGLKRQVILWTKIAR